MRGTEERYNGEENIDEIEDSDVSKGIQGEETVIEMDGKSHGEHHADDHDPVGDIDNIQISVRIGENGERNQEYGVAQGKKREYFVCANTDVINFLSESPGKQREKDADEKTQTTTNQDSSGITVDHKVSYSVNASRFETVRREWANENFFQVCTTVCI